MWYYITLPFAYVINLLYSLTGNYGLTIILFTIITRIILWPLTMSSQKSMAEMQKIQPELQKIQEKYKNDKNKQSEETMKLYQEHHCNPMGGCLPLLIQFPLIMAIYQVVTKPMTYMMKFSSDKIADIIAQLNAIPELSSQKLSAGTSEIQLMSYITEHGLDKTIDGFNGINFDFLGLNLSQVPMQYLGSWMTNLIWIIPVLSLLSSYLVSKLSASMTANRTNNDPDNKTVNQAQQMSKSMTYMMPLMSGYFTLVLPAGVGIYWIISNLWSVGQQYYINKKYRSKPADDVIDVKPKKTKKQ